MQIRFRAQPRTTQAILVLTGWFILQGCTPHQAVATESSNEAANRVRFSVSSGREVPNDWVTANVGITAEDADPAALADTINRTMAWALEQVRAENRVESKSGGYNTYPVHEKGRVRRWRAHQNLIIESTHVEAMTKLVGILQERLQLESFQFSVSRETRERVEEELVSEALTAFRARAELVRKGLGASGYAIDDLNLNTGGGGGPRPMIMRAVAEADYAMPAVEGGSSRVEVTAQGSIVLE